MGIWKQWREKRLCVWRTVWKTSVETYKWQLLEEEFQW